MYAFAPMVTPATTVKITPPFDETEASPWNTRMPVSVPIRILVGPRRVFSTEIIELSLSGALVRLYTTLPIWTHVEVRLNERPVVEEKLPPLPAYVVPTHAAGAGSRVVRIRADCRAFPAESTRIDFGATVLGSGRSPSPRRRQRAHRVAARSRLPSRIRGERRARKHVAWPAHADSPRFGGLGT